MNKRALIIAVLLFVLIVAGMFVFAYLKRGEMENPAPVAEQSTTDVSSDTKPKTVERIDAKHYYIDGVHTIAGEIMMPTACDLLSWNVAQMDDGKRSVVSFDVRNNAEMCAQVQTPQRFKVGFKAPEDASIETWLSGQQIPLNLIPAGESESPADFQLFIKG